MNLLNINLKEYIEENLSKDSMITTIASLATGDNARVGGCTGELNAAKFIEKKFKDLGLSTEIQKFDLNRPVSIGKGTLNLENKSFTIKAFNGSTDIPNNFSSELVYIGLGTKEDLETIGSLNGKIALIKRGNISFKEKAVNAFEAGANAIIIFNDSNGISTGSLGTTPPTVPILGMNNEDGENLVELLNSKGALTLTKDNFDIDIEFHKTSVSHNVIGNLYIDNYNNETKTIILGAHFDSASSPGASDNASGVSVVLEVAKLLSSYEIRNLLKYNIKFLAFGSEELGLLGSQAFVELLKSEDGVSNIQAMINLDMVGVGDCINVFTANKELSKDISDIAVKYIQSGDGVYGGDYTNMTNSDHGPFETVGIPSCLVQTGPDHHFHTENDTIEKIDLNNLYNVAIVVANTILEAQNLKPRC